MGNYRPISILPSFSKIFELIICLRITEFPNSYDFFGITQHGFLKGKSAQIFELTKTILGLLEDKLFLAMILDMSKAYDSINQEHLLNKLQAHGIRGKAFKWIKSYLCKRKQKVKINMNGQTAESEKLTNDRGIAQGGSLLFLIFLNHL